MDFRDRLSKKGMGKTQVWVSPEQIKDEKLLDEMALAAVKQECEYPPLEIEWNIEQEYKSGASMNVYYRYMSDAPDTGNNPIH